MFVMPVGMRFDGGLHGNELFEHVDQFLESRVAGEELFDLGTKFRTFPSCLLVRKYVIVVLHDVFGILWRDHTIHPLIASLLAQ